MGFPDERADGLALELTETDFDAVERDGYRAMWTDADTHVAVTDLGTGDSVVYEAEDLVRATSGREVRQARSVNNGE